MTDILGDMLKQSKVALSKVEMKLHALALKSVLVGIPAAANNRKADESITNSQIAYIQNFGAPEINIPAREFMYSGIRNAQTRIVKALKLAGMASFNGGNPDTYLAQAGLVAQASIKAKITDGPFIPLAAGTVAARQSRGKKSDKPLIDTGQLRNAITYVIKDN
jgi:phage gpG-like protein